MNDNSAQPLLVVPFGQDRRGLVEAVKALLQHVRDASSTYLNRTHVVHLSENSKGAADAAMSWSLGLDLKDIICLAAICQAPMALRGQTDKGKSALAELALNGLFGEHGKQWWRVEISRGMALDDLIEVDLRRLSESTISQAISASAWLSFPGRLLDEINRAPAKLNNMLLHIVDGSGLHVRGNLHVPVGLPYAVGSANKRYSFTIVTANERSAGYDGVFEEDAALLRRIVLSLDLEALPPSAKDISELLERRRPKNALPECSSQLTNILRIHESLPDTIPMSPLGHLFLHYLSGLGSCVRTRSGRQHATRQSSICEKCHLFKSHRFCGRVGGVSEGLLLWIKEIAAGIAALRAAKVLEKVAQDCQCDQTSQLQKFLGVTDKGERLYEVFCSYYLDRLAIKGEDIVAAYVLVAPGHVRIDSAWLSAQESYEHNEAYAFADIGIASWNAMQAILRQHKALFDDLVSKNELSAAHQTEVEAMVTTEDAAMLHVVSALGRDGLAFNFQEAFGRSQGAPKTARIA